MNINIDELTKLIENIINRNDINDESKAKIIGHIDNIVCVSIQEETKQIIEKTKQHSDLWNAIGKGLDCISQCYEMEYNKEITVNENRDINLNPDERAPISK